MGNILFLLVMLKIIDLCFFNSVLLSYDVFENFGEYLES